MKKTFYTSFKPWEFGFMLIDAFVFLLLQFSLISLSHVIKSVGLISHLSAEDNVDKTIELYVIVSALT